MSKKLIKDVSKFYNEHGWKLKDNVTTDANLFEDLRDCSKEYVKICRLKINKHIPKKGNNILDFASGPIQYNEYLTYSKNFKKRHCVDFSKDAILTAKKKLGLKGVYYCEDFIKLKFKKNFFDCSLSLHTIYHINKNLQKNVVKKLINITKKNSPIIIIYSNPNTILNKIKKILKYKNKKKAKIYFYCHPIKWWRQFEKYADIKIYPWRSFSSQHQKILFPDNFIGKIMFKLLLILENNFKNFFSKNFQYYFVVIKKH